MTKTQLKKHRLALGMSQKQFAAILGLKSNAAVSRMESGDLEISPRTKNTLTLYLENNSKKTK